MRIMPRKFTGFVAGQFTVGHEGFYGVMSFVEGEADALLLPKPGVRVATLYKDLKRGDRAGVGRAVDVR